MRQSTRAFLSTGLLTATLILAGATAASTASAPSATPPGFTKKPTVAKDGGGIKIDFAVNRETDLAVFVENVKGEIVRHVAAGVLGKNAPSPLKAGSLEQSIVWDGKDDDGKVADGGPFKVRVGLGLTARYAGLAFADADKTGPNRLDWVAGLVTGPDGRVYVMDKWAGLAWWGTNKIHVVRHDGAYEKTIKPFPSDLPPDRLKGIAAFVNSFGAINPLLYRAEGTAFYPQEEVFQQPTMTPDGRIVLATRGKIAYYGSPTSHIAILDSDGGVPEGGFSGPALPGNWGQSASLSISSDGKSVYFVGLTSGGGKKAASAVYVVRLPEGGDASKMEKAEVVFGDPAKAGDDDAHLNAPKSVACDGKGHLLVADFAANRVVVVNEKDKTFAGSFAVAAPSWVGANPKTGAIYVCSRQKEVIKFAGAANPKDVKEVARADLSKLLEKFTAKVKKPGDPWFIGTGEASFHSTESPLSLTVDASSNPPAVWVGCGSQLVRFDDDGEQFAAGQPAGLVGDVFLWRPAADPARKQLVCRIEHGPNGWGGELSILDEAADKVRLISENGVAGREGRTHRLGPDGCIYAVDHSGAGVMRFTPDGKPKPFAATLKDPVLHGRLHAGQTGTTMWERDFWVDRQGDIYVRRNGSAYHGQMTVEVYDQDGNFKRTVLWMVSDGMYGPRVDAQGNIYIMDIIKPLGEPYPKEFNGRITAKGGAEREGMHWYDWIYGSVIKFGPEGGAIWFGPGRLPQASPLNFDGWRPWSSEPRGWAECPGDPGNSVADLKIASGSLVATIAKKPATIAFPMPGALNAATQNKITFRLKNDSDGATATIRWHVLGEGWGVDAKTRSIDIKPNSDFTEYTFDLAGEKNWKGNPYMLSLVPTDGAKGSFAIDWVRIGDGNEEGKTVWNFKTEDSRETKLSAAMKTEKVGAWDCPKGADLQGALWWRPGFGHVGQTQDNDHCHCCGSDFDMDDFGRIFAPDSGRCRVGVLDANGNDIISFGSYGNQDFSGPDSYVVDPKTKLLRPRKADDPKDLVSPFAQPGCPQIALGWIMGLAVTDRYAYVDDLVNRRILRVKLDYVVTETVGMP